MLRIALFLALIALVGIWYIVRPPGRSWAECETLKGTVCVPKTP